MFTPCKMKSVNFLKAGFIFCLLSGYLAFHTAYAQIVINEVCAYNGNVIEDEDGDESDWFELYNNSISSVSLSGYSVADNTEIKWFFPDTVIAPHKYLLVFASGKDRIDSTLHTSFKISKDGDKISLFDATGNIIDSVQTGKLHLDHSTGRFPNGSGTIWHIFKFPTPCISNDLSTAYIGFSDDPIYSIDGGFYQGNPMLSLSNNQPSSVIHYTTNGSIPEDTSAIYTAQIPLSVSTVVRARTFSIDTNILPSKTITNTYIINYFPKLPVISISTNPENLWDWNTGIYVLGPNADSVYPYHGANYWQDWEVPAHIEFFETNRTLAFEQDAGLSINGGSVSRTRPQQSFRITARNKYGKPEMEHRIFQEKTIDKFKIIVLRNSSGDYNKTHFRDGSLHKLMLGHVNIDLLCYRPSVIYLNGEYWGILNIREKFSKYYLQENHNADPDKIDILEEDSTIVQGNFDAFHAMHDFVTGNDMRQAANYDSAAAMIDIESFCDYFIAETCLSNIDWPYNNIKYWRERAPGKKWRYLMFDLDISLGNNGWANADLDYLGKIMGPYGDDNKHVQLLKSLLKNTGFRNYFINRYADLVNTLFSSTSIMDNTRQVMDALVADIPLHFNRWGNNMEGWYNEINTAVIPYINDRPYYALQFVRDTFRLKKEVNVELDVWPSAGGSIHINTIEPGPMPWNGIYFDGVPINVTAVANPGFTFVQWQSDPINLSNSQLASITLNVDTNNRFIAFFSSTNHPAAISVNPNPADKMIKAGFILENECKGSLSLCNAFGSVVKTIETEFAAGPNFCSFETAGLAEGFYFIHLKTPEGERSAKVIIVH
jgi:hypothetical protein